MCYSVALNRTALSGDAGLKIVDMSNFTEIKEDAINLTDSENNEATTLSYTSDGQILTIATVGGIVQNFLARMPIVHAHYETQVVYLSSLRELTIVDVTSRHEAIKIDIVIEPAFVSLGPLHVAVGMNNHVWYYDYHMQSTNCLVNEQEYLGTVSVVKMNREYAAVLTEGKVTLHSIVSPKSSKMESSRSSKVIPERQDAGISIRSIAMTRDFLIYSTQNGTLEYFYLLDWAFLAGSEYRHDEAITQIYPNRKGTCWVCMVVKQPQSLLLLYRPTILSQSWNPGTLGLEGMHGRESMDKK
jgi:WD repeat-containing protein 19